MHQVYVVTWHEPPYDTEVDACTFKLLGAFPTLEEALEPIRRDTHVSPAYGLPYYSIYRLKLGARNIHEVWGEIGHEPNVILGFDANGHVTAQLMPEPKPIPICPLGCPNDYFDACRHWPGNWDQRRGYDPICTTECCPPVPHPQA